MVAHQRNRVMKSTRRNHGAAFKAKVALATLKDHKTLAEHFGMHPTQIMDGKPYLPARASDVFGVSKRRRNINYY
jgi:hypothetical protein